MHSTQNDKRDTKNGHMIIDKIYNPRDCCHRLYFDLECFPSNAISSVNPASLAMSRAVRPSWREETEGLIMERTEGLIVEGGRRVNSGRL